MLLMEIVVHTKEFVVIMVTGDPSEALIAVSRNPKWLKEQNEK